MASIKILSDNIVNQIAAGEVVERPFSVVKELVENSIDAGATEIRIQVENGGKNLIVISDNGSGMDRQDLELCVQRHATSKLKSDDLQDINSFGFRGEALASIASVSRLKVSTNNGDKSICLTVEAGKVGDVKPCSMNKGTRIEVMDLFYNVPARLKFLKSDRAETSAIIDVVEKIALANPNVTFSLNDRVNFLAVKTGNKLEDLKLRFEQVFGKKISDQLITVDVNEGGLKIYGFISRPTFNKANTLYQHIFVNGRPVKDKLVSYSLKVAYMDVLEKGRFPVVDLFIELDKKDVDVNVHPQKQEVRFLEPNFIRGAIISVVKNALAIIKGSAFEVDLDSVVNKENPVGQNNNYIARQNTFSYGEKTVEVRTFNDLSSVKPSVNERIESLKQTDFSQKFSAVKNEDFKKEALDMQENVGDFYPLGFAVAQVENTYIVSQVSDGIIITDQHAGHERIVYEKLKKQLFENTVEAQGLLVPEILDLSKKQLENILLFKDDLSKFGFDIDVFGQNSLAINSIPAVMKNVDYQKMFEDIADNISMFIKDISLEEKLLYIFKTKACHGSVRAGQKLSFDEMNALLRDLEKTDNSNQCNHGRPVYVKMPVGNIAKLFDR